MHAVILETGIHNFWFWIMIFLLLFVQSMQSTFLCALCNLITTHRKTCCLLLSCLKLKLIIILICGSLLNCVVKKSSYIHAAIPPLMDGNEYCIGQRRCYCINKNVYRINKRVNPWLIHRLIDWLVGWLDGLFGFQSFIVGPIICFN